MIFALKSVLPNMNGATPALCYFFHPLSQSFCFILNGVSVKLLQLDFVYYPIWKIWVFYVWIGSIYSYCWTDIWMDFCHHILCFPFGRSFLASLSCASLLSVFGWIHSILFLSPFSHTSLGGCNNNSQLVCDKSLLCSKKFLICVTFTATMRGVCDYYIHTELRNLWRKSIKQLG